MDPKYLKLLAANELETRVEKLEALLASCTVCPKDCGNDRLKDEIAACYSGRLPIVSSYFGLNSAKVYGIDLKQKMNAIPADYITKLKAKYRAGGASPSNTQYGWIRV